MLAYLKEWLAGFNVPSFSVPGVGLTEVLDILIVACLLYFVLKWIRHTRTWSLFKGIVILLIIAAAAYLFNLVTVIWLVQNAFTMGLIAVVVLFQPELRKALEQIGRNRYFASFTKADNDRNTHVTIHTINEVVKAAKEMAAVRTGALIVIEQDVALGDYERTGIPLDAIVSSQLLLNIFEKNTPLHDGAIIIRQSRVTAATCILPLTAEEIGRELGTRHRAAVGMSEVSDALVLVVSEETGAVSMAMGGRLSRDLNEYQIREVLMKGDSGEPKPRFHLFKNRKGTTSGS